MKTIEDLSTELYEEVLSIYNNQGEYNRKAFGEILEEKLIVYNDAVSIIIMNRVYSNINSAFISTLLPSAVLTKPKLSDMLYNNAKRVSSEVVAILNDSVRVKIPINQMSRKLYDGYGFNDKEVLDIKRKMPLYLKRELKNNKVSKEFIKYVDNIKTKPLKTALHGIINKMDGINNVGLQKALQVILEEKSRYYANRIATTEHHRATNIARAKEYMDDSEIEFVKHQMSSGHPMTDICDYYDTLDVGYGKGIYRKEDMITVPHHPWCLCRYNGYYDKVTKKVIENPEKSTLEKFSLHDRKAILGSSNKVQRFYNGESVVDIFNSSRKKYPIKKYSEIL